MLVDVNKGVTNRIGFQEYVTEIPGTFAKNINTATHNFPLVNFSQQMRSPNTTTAKSPVSPQ